MVKVQIFTVLTFVLGLNAKLLPVVAQKTDRPVLVIQVVVEQMRYDMIERYWNSFTHKGFRRMFFEGAFCRNASYDYLVTESAPGYATLVSGNNPAGHGIISDTWYARLKDKDMYCVSDPELAEKPGIPSKNKYSPTHLIGSTLGDELRMSNYKQSQVISISDKPYASILSSGHIGNAAYWIDSESGQWTTSPYYMDKLPDWVEEFNRKELNQLYLSRDWTLLKPEGSYKESLPDNNSYEKGFGNKQRTFPYKLSELKSTDGASVITSTPFGNTYTLDFAMATILNEKLGMDQFPDLLTISFGAAANVCDLFGINSMELQDIYLRLDKDLAHLLEFIDEKFGRDNVLIVLTSDRGAPESNEFLDDIGMPTGKFYANQAISLLESYLKALYGFTGWVKKYSDRQVYLNDLVLDASKTVPGEIAMKAAQFLVQFQAVAVATTGVVMQSTNFTDGDLAKFQKNYNMERSGDILISLKPGFVEVSPILNRNLNEEYSPYRYNSHIPLVFYGSKIKKKEVLSPVSITDVAPTISKILGIGFPSGTKGRILEDILQD
jgi:hypothetical protein